MFFFIFKYTYKGHLFITYAQIPGFQTHPLTFYTRHDVTDNNT